MFNIGGGELLIIFLVALVVLGPTKLPEAARQIGKVMGEFRRLSAGFQNELKSAMDDPVARAMADAEKADVRTPTKPREDTVDVTAVAEVPPIPDADPAPFQNTTYGSAHMAKEEAEEPADEQATASSSEAIASAADEATTGSDAPSADAAAADTGEDPPMYGDR